MNNSSITLENKKVTSPTFAFFPIAGSFPRNAKINNEQRGLFGRVPMAVASGDGAVYFFQPKFHLHLNPNDSAHYQVCDSICASELDPLTLYFAHRSNLYTYNIFTKEASFFNVTQY